LYFVMKVVGVFCAFSCAASAACPEAAPPDCYTVLAVSFNRLLCMNM
jgi:hypothetical protein